MWNITWIISDSYDNLKPLFKPIFKAEALGRGREGGALRFDFFF